MKRKIGFIILNVVVFIAIRWVTIIFLFLAGMGAGNHAQELVLEAIYLPQLLIQIVILYLILRKIRMFEIFHFVINLAILVLLYVISMIHIIPFIIPY